ncbi:MAG: DUF2764 family protein [Victivallaceae bacterium]|nr:DUF2764 family protein [Victivallaceae bacterium]
MNYYYLASSLPMLRSEEKPPVSTGDFLAAAARELSEANYENLLRVSIDPEAANPEGAAREFAKWETLLRNAVLRIRAAKYPELADDLRHEDDFFSEVAPGVQEALGKANLLEREKALDAMRWRKLDDLEAGHPADFDFLAVYKLKLAILEKNAVRTRPAGEKNVDDLANLVLADADRRSGNLTAQ